MWLQIGTNTFHISKLEGHTRDTILVTAFHSYLGWIPRYNFNLLRSTFDFPHCT